jgi:sulfur carrier protein
VHIVVNGKEREVPQGIHLGDVLALLKLTEEDSGIAIAKNDEVIPRSAWTETIVKAGDRIEIVTASQGG